MDARTYNASPSALASLQTKLKSHGLTVDLSAAGEAKEGGWDVSWAHPDPVHIAITVVKHPFLEESAFWSQIESLVGPAV